MSTAVENPAPAAKANPLSDSLMAMIDQAHAEPVKADMVESAGVQSPQPSDKPVSTPPIGKAAPVKEDKPPKTEAKAEDKKADEAKPEKIEAKKEPEPAEVFKKRLNEQTAVNSRLGRELKEAQEQIKVLKQKFEGTYEPPAEPTPEERARVDEFRGKETASRRMATEKYGETFVNSQIYDDGAPYQQLVAAQPWHHLRVANADNPVEEALRVLQERKVYEELGPNPDAWEAAIKEKVRAEVLEEIKKQQEDSSVLVGKTVPGVGDARGAAEGREPVKVEEEFSLAALGGHFLD